MSEPVLVIAGPTAVGKSSLALAVAHAIGGEVVAADSRQLYRGLDIGTAKASTEERARVRHHLLDWVDPGVRVSAGSWMDEAESAITDIQQRGRRVVVVGGSTLYVHALVAGLADLPPINRALEESLSAIAATRDGAANLFEELRHADPDAASTLDPTKTHRLVRWVGVLRETGQQPSVLWAERPAPKHTTRLFVLDRPRKELYARIDRRVDQMMAEGLLDELRALLGLEGARDTLGATIGYQELISVLEGERSLEEGVRLVKRNSRRYAKRQLTWYRRYPDARWLDARTATVADVLDAAGP